MNRLPRRFFARIRHRSAGKAGQARARAIGDGCGLAALRSVCALLLAALAGCTDPAPTQFVLPALDEAQYHWIGARIFRNEAGGDERLLTHWGAGEEFPSFGIGHFIWFPAGVDAPFDESFPALVEYLREHEVSPMPDWLARLAPFDAPWPDKTSFDAALDSEEMQELRLWLAATASGQAKHIVASFVERWNGLELPPAEKKELTEVLRQLVATPQGLFAIIDYVNFKGLGSNPRERYRGHGWGLLQVLGDVASTKQPDDDAVDLVRRFSDAAAARLRNRVALAPPERNEARWLPGWTRRVLDYTSDDSRTAPSHDESVPGSTPR